jgi:hypothetical protein
MPDHPLTEFKGLIENYTSRSLSYDSDALNAVAGVSSHLRQQNLHPAYSLRGVPLYRDPRGILSVEHSVAHALAWWDIENQSLRRDVFPSWTWAGWTGRVQWPHLDERYNHTDIRNFELQNRSGEQVHLRERNGLFQRDLDSVVAVLFDAPFLPVTCFRLIDDELCVIDQSLELMRFEFSPDVAHSLLPNLLQGVWSCIVLEPFNSSGADNWRAFSILQVSWTDKQSAERLGCFPSMPLSIEEVHEFESMTYMRRVSLV